MHMVQKHGKESFLTWSKNQVKEAIPNNMTISQSKTTESRVIDSKTPKTVKSNKIIVSSQEEAEVAWGDIEGMSAKFRMSLISSFLLSNRTKYLRPLQTS